MAYKLKHGDSVAEGVKRIVREEGREAARNLRGRSGVPREEAVHEVCPCAAYFAPLTVSEMQRCPERSSR
jgi:hypothetical protein